MTNVFKGEKAVLDFLNPVNQQPTPLVEIPTDLNPLHKKGVRIYAKLLNLLPLGNIKSIPAFYMLQQAEEKGELKGVTTIVESSSGNTAYSLATTARLLGIPTTKAYVSNEVSKGKLDLLKLFGVRAVVNDEPICPKYDDRNSGIYKAKEDGKESAMYNPGQYDNQRNPKAHEMYTGKQIYEQLDKDLQVFGVGVGTTGTLVGCSTYFKKQNKSIRVVGIARSKNNPIPGVRTQGLLEMTGFDWQSHIDSMQEIGTKESYALSLSMIRQGLVVGPSSGFCLAGLLQDLNKLDEQGLLDELRNKHGQINAAFICCDTPYPYMQEYFSYLDTTDFPEIQNDHLLKNIDLSIEKHADEIEPLKAYTLIYSQDEETLWQNIKDKTKIETKIPILDVRTNEEFKHFHLAGSINEEYDQVIEKIENYVTKYQGKIVLIVCSHGIRSQQISILMKQEGISSFSLEGGLASWSQKDLPRWKPDICF